MHCLSSEGPKERWAGGEVCQVGGAGIAGAAPGREAEADRGVGAKP